MVVGEYWWLIYLVFLAIPLARILPRIASRNKRRMNRYGDDSGSSTANGPDAYGRSGVSSPPPPPPPSPRPDVSAAARRASRETRPSENRRGRTSGDRATGSQGGTRAGAEQTNEMIVLGVMHRGAKNFGSIQKMTGMDDAVLERSLENLENRNLIRVVQKQGLLGVKVELYPTDKGFQHYYS